ncbi:MAG: hypothetical protein M3406_02180 [Chloroflexota bacterium]|nr:hypothetical protein [Chloroflexota bacterium]
MLFGVLAAASTLITIGLGGLMLALLLSASAPSAPLAASLLKFLGLALYFAIGGSCVWLWMRHKWAVLVMPLVAVTSQLAVVQAGNAFLSWTIRFGPAP